MEHIMNKNSIVAQSFNKAIEVGFNNYLKKHAKSENSEIKIDEDKLIQDLEEKWLNQAIDEIGNISPKEYINSLTALEETVELFIEIASISDVGIPDLVIDKLKEYGVSAADMLFEFAKNSFDSDKEENKLAITQAIFAIGCLKCDEYKEKLIGLLIECCNDEMISEAICSAIVEYGSIILEDLIKTFNETDIELVKEYLLVCISEISKEHPSDNVFYLLKNAFRSMNNKKVAAEVIGDYGDGRAIPLLRGYIQRNTDKIDKDTFNLVRAVIKKLGGEIDDLVYFKTN